jgi:hypothetical protein
MITIACSHIMSLEPPPVLNQQGAQQPVAGVHVSEALEVLSAAGSVWHREDIIRVFCDLQRPVPGVDGTERAQIIEAAADHVIEQCVDLDPQRVSGDVCGRGVRVVE